uniref:SMP-30/Gluconolactonase/LRE-like region domain-containing protein n=1 Tax=Arcella intermedia TaxID=1963864 RepID=A0A6B2LNY9_9EUKA
MTLTALFNNPSGVCMNQEGELFITDWNNGALRRISNGFVYTVGEKMFKKPRGLCFNEDGGCFVTDEEEQRVLRVKMDSEFCCWELRWRKRIEEMLLCLKEYGLPREIRITVVSWLLMREGIKNGIREMLYYF